MTTVTSVAARLALACLLATVFAPLVCMAQPVPPNLTMPFPVWHKGVIAVPPSTTGNTYYVDGTGGSDSNAGTSSGAPFKTIAKALTKIAAGDTVLIKKGLYREGINVPVSGTALKPVTFGSFGDGEVILDGSKKVTGWTNVGGTVWQATATFTPVAVVVNEVPLKQVPEGQNGSTAPAQTAAAVTSGSGKWHVNYTSKLITADFGTVIGSGDPNTADVIVPDDNGSAQFVFWFGVSYVTFKGLTVRGNGSNGMWGYGDHVTIDSCDIKFNGKAAVSYLSGSGLSNNDNAVLMSHAYHNVLINWPRGNNGAAEDGGGWPGTVVWDTNLRPVARGNVVHMNGGEGIITYGTASGLSSGSALFEQNVSYDNWSVNMYFDNQPNDVARNNFLFNHPPDTSNFLYVSNSYPYDSLEKYTVCLMLADEQNSSDSTGGFANLSGTQVYNNVLAGCRISIRDYSEGTQAIANHGLKNTLIANNTIVMPFNTFTNSDTFGIYLQDNGTKSTGSSIVDNIVYGFNSDPLVASEKNGTIPGVAIDYNEYYSAAAHPFMAGFNTVVSMTFTQWKTAMSADTNSLFADPLLVDVTAFRATAASVPTYDFNNARITGSSPAVGAGTSLVAGLPLADFVGNTRPTPRSIGAFEPAFFTTTTALTSSFNPSTAGQAVTFKATVSFIAATGTVTFKDGTTTLCGGGVAVVAGIANCTVSNLAVGSHSITAQYSGDSTYSTSTSGTVVQVVNALPVALAKLDFDGDGNEDLVFEDADGSVEIWLMNGTTVKLMGTRIVPTLPGHVMHSAGDFDGDGKADLLFQRLDGSVEMWLMDGTAIKATGVIMPISHGWSVVGTGDFDADGKSDILWHNLDGTVGLWLMNGTTQKQRTSIIGAGAVSVPTHVGDFNGDGKSDIVWRSSYDGTVYIWLMNGLVAADRGPVMNGPTTWEVLQTADLDHDGRSDLVWQNTADGTVSVWTMNGRAIVTKGPVMPANTNWTVTDTGDINGDGNADLFWLGRDGSVGTWLMSGLTVLNKKTQFAAGSGWTVGAIGDYDNDGKDDIIWTNASGAVSVWLMNGLDFGAKTPLLPAGSTSRVVKVHFNH